MVVKTVATVAKYNVEMEELTEEKNVMAVIIVLIA